MRALIVLLSISLALGMPVSVAYAVESTGAKPLPPAVEQCIRDNASKVEAAQQDLNAATDFLVNKVCAVPVAQDTALQLKSRQVHYVEQLKKACDAQKAKPVDDAGSAMRSGLDPCAMQTMSGVYGGVDDVQEGYDGVPTYPGAASPSVIALASQLLLELRLSHSKPGQTH